MATNKKAISAYLPTDIEEYLTKYCTEYDITRKDKSGEIKPALGTAVVEILKIFFNNEDLPSPLPDNVPLLPSNVVTEDRLSEVLSELRTSGNVVNNLPSNVLTEDDLERQVEAAIAEAIPKAIANLKSDEEFLEAIALRARDSIASEVQKIYTIAAENNLHPSENILGQAEAKSDETTTTQVDKASLEPIFDELEESEAGKLLSKKEAFAIALSRGYKSGDTAFAQWFRDNKGGTLHGIKKHSDRGKYIDVGI